MNNPVINNQTMDSNQTWLEGEMMGCMDKPTTEEWCPPDYQQERVSEIRKVFPG